jgi:hypothetical protein
LLAQHLLLAGAIQEGFLAQGLQRQLARNVVLGRLLRGRKEA